MLLNDVEVSEAVNQCLDDFYNRRIAKLSTLKLHSTLKRKNPYLFRATGVESANDLVEEILKAYMSSSDEGIFGDAFFEPLAKLVSKGETSGAEGVDIVIQDATSYKAFAVKSGPSVFNAQSRKRQNTEFQKLQSRLFKLQKQFDPIVGYAYGRKNATKSKGSVIFRELAGQAFWEELTGDPDFYLRIIQAMRDKPDQHKAFYRVEWDKAKNRFLRDFTTDFCKKDGSIDWEKLLCFNSGKILPKSAPKLKKK